MDEIIYDWPFDSHSHPKIIKHEDGYEINKTFIYQKNEKYFVDYKTDHIEITEEVFKRMHKLYNLLYGDEDVS